MWVASIHMSHKAETRSQNSRHVILKYEDNLYHVNKVNVQYSEAKKAYNAVFRAKRLSDNQLLDLDFDISQKLYDTLIEYTKLDDSDLLLVLQAENNAFKWSLFSESWVRQQMTSKVGHYVI
jgi:adenosine deaminase